MRFLSVLALGVILTGCSNAPFTPTTIQQEARLTVNVRKMSMITIKYNDVLKGNEHAIEVTTTVPTRTPIRLIWCPYQEDGTLAPCKTWTLSVVVDTTWDAGE